MAAGTAADTSEHSPASLTLAGDRHGSTEETEKQVIGDNTVSTEETAPADDEPFNPGLGFYLAFSSLLVNAIMISFDSTSVGVVLPSISADLGGTSTQAFWTGSSFLLASAVFQPPIAALSHIFGRRQALIFSVASFLVGVVISSVAHNFRVMLAGRTLQGIGGGGMVLISDVIVTDLVPLRQRGIYYGIVGAMWVIGMSAGPVVGGAFALNVTWRWIFWILLPFAVTSLIIVPLFMKLKQVHGSTGTKLRRVDWIGNLLFIGAATSFLMPVTWGGTQYAWTSPSTLVPLFVGAAGFLAFALYERFVPAEPTLPLELFNSYNMAYSFFSALVNGGLVYGALYYLPLYFEVAKGYNPVVAGVAVLPSSLSIAPFSIVAGHIISRQGDTRPVTWFGWIASTIGLGVMTMLDENTSIPAFIFMTLCMGMGQGLLYTSLLLITQAASTDENMAFAIGMFIFFRLLGQAVGVAIGGSIFQNQIRERLAGIPALVGKEAEYSRDASGLVQTIRDMPAGTAKSDLISAYAGSLRIVWAVYCALAGVAMVTSFFLKKHDMDRKLNTEQGLELEKKKDEEKP